MGGDIHVDSTPGRGSRFGFTLDLPLPADAPGAAAPWRGGLRDDQLGMTAGSSGAGPVEAADRALYLAKAAGRGRVSWVEG